MKILNKLKESIGLNRYLSRKAMHTFTAIKEELNFLNEKLLQKDLEIERLKSKPTSLKQEEAIAELHKEYYDTWQQAINSQAREVLYREKLKELNLYAEHTGDEFAVSKIKEILDTPYETSSLEIAVTMAGEIMRYRCIEEVGSGSDFGDCTPDSLVLDMFVLPKVALKDIL